MAEIIQVIEKHDVAAVVAIATPDQMEYLIHPNASWNCISVHDGYLRINSTGLPKEKKKEQMENSVGVVMAFKHISEVFNGGFSDCAEMLSGHFDIEHMMRRFQ